MPHQKATSLYAKTKPWHSSHQACTEVSLPKAWRQPAAFCFHSLLYHNRWHSWEEGFSYLPSYLEKQEAVMPCVWHMQLAKDVSLLLQRAPLAFPSHSRRRKHCLGWILGLLLFMRFPSHHNISINKKSEKRKTAEIRFLSFVFGTEC